MKLFIAALLITTTFTTIAFTYVGGDGTGGGITKTRGGDGTGGGLTGGDGSGGGLTR